VQPGRAKQPGPGESQFSPRFICSYLKICGVLRQLAPGGDEFPEFGEGYEMRQANLRTLVGRAKRHGIGVYLYINEPRAMPAKFFENRPDMAGVASQRMPPNVLLPFGEGEYVAPLILARYTIRKLVRRLATPAGAHSKTPESGNTI